jgi:hypothetical protein
MSGVCILAAGKTLALAATAFTLSWTHSVEKTEWREAWALTPAGFELTQARVKGSGAGMDPGPGATEQDGWWIWQPKTPPVPQLVLAASGATVSPWTLCTDQRCLDLGAQAGDPVVIAPCTK